MKTEQIDFRKDTPPTNWLLKQALEDTNGVGYREEDIKSTPDCFEEFISEFSELRCEPVCSNGQLAASVDVGVAAGANTNGQLAPSCICSLVEQLTSPDADVVVPKDAFLAIVGAAGFNKDFALAQYRSYLSGKLWDKNRSEILRLDEEGENAYNWWKELDSDEAFTQSVAATNELDALRDRIAQEVEAAMSA